MPTLDEIDRMEDAPSPFEFRVRAEDIRRATKRDASACAAACGILRENPTVVRVAVGPGITKLEYADGRIVRYETPSVLRDQIVDFDDDQLGLFDTGVYVLKPPHGTARLGARHAKQRGPHSTAQIDRTRVHARRTHDIVRFGKARAK